MKCIKQLFLILLIAIGSAIGQKAMASCNGSDSISYVYLGNGRYEFMAWTSGINNPRYFWSPNLYTTATADTITATFTAGWHSIAINVADSGQPCAYYDSINFYVPNYGCNLSGHITQQNFSTYDELTATVSGGTGSYNYGWTVNATGLNYYQTAVYNNGIYTVTVTDDSTGCTLVMSDTVAGLPCSMSDSIWYVNTGNGHYIFTAHTTGATNPFYEWHLPNYTYPGATHEDTVSFNCSPGWNHIAVYIQDSGVNCFYLDSIVFYVPACTLSGYMTNDSVSAGVDTLGVYAFGTAPYIYAWSTGATANHIMVFTPGTYCVTVTDANGCTGTFCSTVLPGGCNLSGSIARQLQSTYDQLTANVSGGTGLYSYHWSANANAFNYNNVNVYNNGLYKVTVTDDSTGCSIVLADTVSNLPCSISDSISYINTGGGHYIFTAHTAGAVHPIYTWVLPLWNQVITTHDTISYTYAAGWQTISVEIQDSGTNCYYFDSISFNVSTNCTLGVNTNQYTYSGYDLLNAVVTGGAAPYSYQWSNGESADTISVSASAMYCITVTDHNGCTASNCDSVNLANSCSAQFTYNDSCGVIVFLPYGTLYYDTITYVFGDGSSFTNTLDAGNVDHVYASAGYYYVTLYVHGAGGCSDSATNQIYASNAPCSGYNIICGTVFYDANGDGVQDGGETGLANQEIQIMPGGNIIYTNANGQYTDTLQAGVYSIRLINNGGYTYTQPVGSNNTAAYAEYDSVYIFTGGYTQCGFNFGVIDSEVTISGYVYFDANNNGMMDAGESGLGSALVYIGPHMVWTNNLGFYTWTGPVGAYTVSYSPSSAYTAYVVVPGSGIFVNATSGIYTGNNFGLQVAVAACDIATQIIATTTITAGYPTGYDVYVENYGTNVAAGTMTFFYDPSLIYGGAIPSPASVNTTGHVLTFNYSGLQPGQYDVFFISFTADSAIGIGQATFEMATATDNCIESNLANNTDTVHQNATASWDPNSKVVTPSGTGPQGLIRATQPLRYTINFQNTGTAPAVNIVLQDDIPASLNLSMLKVIGASHPNYALQVNGRKLLCRFSQIMLPDSAANEKASHGYLSFEIQPAQGIADGTQIQNTASIYFDYNAAVVTNTTLNTIDNELSVADIENHATISVVPNPFRDYTTISVSGIDTKDMTLEVYDVMGQRVVAGLPAANGAFALHRGTMNAGVYMYQINQNGHFIGSGKLVVIE